MSHDTQTEFPLAEGLSASSDILVCPETEPGPELLCSKQKTSAFNTVAQASHIKAS